MAVAVAVGKENLGTREDGGGAGRERWKERG